MQPGWFLVRVPLLASSKDTVYCTYTKNGENLLSSLIKMDTSPTIRPALTTLSDNIDWQIEKF